MHDDLILRHLYSNRHHGLQEVSIQLIDKVNEKGDLLAKEGQWAYRLQLSLKPDRLNEIDFFFTLNRRDVPESKILFRIQNYLLYTLLGNLSAIFPCFYTYFPFILSRNQRVSTETGPNALRDVALVC